MQPPALWHAPSRPCTWLAPFSVSLSYPHQLGHCPTLLAAHTMPRPMSLLSLGSRKSSDSQRAKKRSSLLSTASSGSQAISITLPNFDGAAQLRAPCDGVAEMLDDDNFAWGSPTSPRADRRRSWLW